MNWFIKTLEVEVYHLDVVVIIHDDFNEIDKKYKLGLKEVFAPDDPNESHAITHKHPEYHGKTELYLLIKPQYLDIDSFGHEMQHIMSYICSSRGIDVDVDNDEPLAYLQGYLSRKMGEMFYDYMVKNGIDVRSFLAPDKIKSGKKIAIEKSLVSLH